MELGGGSSIARIICTYTVEAQIIMKNKDIDDDDDDLTTNDDVLDWRNFEHDPYYEKYKESIKADFDYSDEGDFPSGDDLEEHF